MIKKNAEASCFCVFFVVEILCCRQTNGISSKSSIYCLKSLREENDMLCPQSSQLILIFLPSLQHTKQMPFLMQGWCFAGGLAGGFSQTVARYVL